MKILILTWRRRPSGLEEREQMLTEWDLNKGFLVPSPAPPVPSRMAQLEADNKEGPHGVSLPLGSGDLVSWSSQPLWGPARGWVLCMVSPGSAFAGEEAVFPLHTASSMDPRPGHCVALIMSEVSRPSGSLTLTCGPLQSGSTRVSACLRVSCVFDIRFRSCLKSCFYSWCFFKPLVHMSCVWFSSHVGSLALRLSLFCAGTACHTDICVEPSEPSLVTKCVKAVPAHPKGKCLQRSLRPEGHFRELEEHRSELRLHSGCGGVLDPSGPQLPSPGQWDHPAPLGLLPWMHILAPRGAPRCPGPATLGFADSILLCRAALAALGSRHQFPQQPFCLFGTVSWGLLEKGFSAEFQQMSTVPPPCLEGSQLLPWLPS
ncbi:uncharacterized protein LOC125089523 [Lutra lutra]|uniref:uncharacterized protein LOC125089523 n=1 Tax=Lutra lutra TaxID=9657 RepID=UPI001FD01DF4|nr:uncharacterized protein LOC125089523 [Lutra lutra]